MHNFEQVWLHMAQRHLSVRGRGGFPWHDRVSQDVIKAIGLIKDEQVCNFRQKNANSMLCNSFYSLKNETAQKPITWQPYCKGLFQQVLYRTAKQNMLLTLLSTTIANLNTCRIYYSIYLINIPLICPVSFSYETHFLHSDSESFPLRITLIVLKCVKMLLYRK